MGRLAFIVALACMGATVAPAGIATAVSVPGPRIIGGTTIDAATVPWTVALLHSSTANGFDAQFCGGTLINAEWVLTAAHCVTATAPSAVNVAWGISDLNAVAAVDRHALSQIIVHPQYNATESTSDVALLRLATPVPGATTLAINTAPTFPALSAALDTYGWGNISTTGTTYPNLLHGVSLQDLGGPSSSGTCGLYATQYIGDHMVCSGQAGGGKDACQGDSGGPLVGTNGATKVLVGVTSWGNGCALNNYPGLWSRVSSYADWIDQQIHAPATPRVSIGDATVVEGDSGSRVANFTVTVSPAPRQPMTVGYATVSDTAVAPADFVAKLATLSFNPGQIVKTVAVSVKSNQIPEPTKSFRVVLATPSGLDGATLANGSGVGTVLDDDSSTLNQLTIGDGSATEGDDGTGLVTVKTQIALTRVPGAPFSVTYTTTSGTAGPRDFVAKTGTLAFTATAMTKTVSITLKREWIPEGNETFTITVGTPTLGSVVTTRATGTFTIINDD